MKILPTYTGNKQQRQYKISCERCVRAAISRILCRLLYRNKFVNMNRDKRIMANGYTALMGNIRFKF